MTREEFVKKHAAEYVTKLLVCADKARHSPFAFGEWMMLQSNEVQAWIGGLHDALTEQLNAQVKSRPEGKSGTAGAGGPQAKGGPGRSTG